MPHLKSNGDIAHGRAGVGACLNNAQFDTGGDPCWFNATTLVYRRMTAGDEYLAYWDIPGAASTQADAEPVTFLHGSGNGHWVAMTPGRGIYSSPSVGYENPSAGLLGMGLDGSIAFRQDYHGSGMDIRALSGEESHITDGPARDVDVINSTQIIWQENQVLKTSGLPDVMVVNGSIYSPKAVLVGGQWWVAYFSIAHGIVLHPANSLTGYKVVPTGDAWLDIIVLAGQPNVIRVAWSISEGEVAGHIFFEDIDTATDPRVEIGPGTTVPGVEAPPPTAPAGPTVTTLTSSATFDVAGAAEELVTLPIEVYPSFPVGEGRGRIIHPTLGAFDYEVKPDEWVNIDADAIIAPVWASSRTLTSAANVLWEGNLRDVMIEERWKALGGIAMPITQLRMLLAIWTTPIDPDVGYVHWFPNYITQVGFKVLPVNLSAGGQGMTFDDIVNYKDEHGEPIGWISAPVTFQLKLVERL